MSAERKKTDQLLKVTRNALNTASFRANQYKQVVQKKIDLGAIHKKIEQLHAELGKAVDDQYHAGQRELLASKEVASLLEKVGNLKRAAVLLEEEIELIRNEPPEGSEPAAEQQAEKDKSVRQ
jgi:hypothetical protein